MYITISWKHHWTRNAPKKAHVSHCLSLVINLKTVNSLKALIYKRLLRSTIFHFYATERVEKVWEVSETWAKLDLQSLLTVSKHGHSYSHNSIIATKKYSPHWYWHQSTWFYVNAWSFTKSIPKSSKQIVLLYLSIHQKNI